MATEAAAKTKAKAKAGGLYPAMLEAGKKFRKLGKDGTGNFGKYGTLPKTLEAVKGPLAEAGLIVMQPLVWEREKVNIESGEITPGRAFLRTIIVHASTGEKIESEVPLNIDREEKKIGASLTYFRRYMIWSLLCIQPEDGGDLDSEGLASNSDLASLRNRSIEMAEDAYGKGSDCIAEAAAAVREAAKKIAGVTGNKVRDDQIANLAIALSKVTLGFGEDGEPQIQAQTRVTGPDPLLQEIVDGKVDPAKMKLTPLPAKEGGKTGSKKA